VKVIWVGCPRPPGPAGETRDRVRPRGTAHNSRQLDGPQAHRAVPTVCWRAVLRRKKRSSPAHIEPLAFFALSISAFTASESGLAGNRRRRPGGNETYARPRTPQETELRS
jgi:hypothetical protein